MPARLAERKPTRNDYRFARHMRRHPTSGEEILWYELRLAAKGRGFRFRRRHPIRPCIADFVCLKLRLIVEVDGVSHETRINKDVKRDAYLEQQGYEIMRFTNKDVISDRQGVILTIMRRCEELIRDIRDIPLP